MGILELVVHYILWPAVILFFLLVQPIPFIRKIASKIVLLFGARVRIMNVSIFLFIGFSALLIWGFELTQWYQKFSDDSRQVEQVKIELLPIDFDKQGRHARRWRLERNLYMGLLTSVLYFALHTIASLVDKLQAKGEDDAAAKKKQ